jgi:predicted RNase H-like HicB family nuclease
MDIQNKDIEYYLGLDWTYTIEKEQHEGKTLYIVRVNELPGICTDSYDLNEAMELIKEAITSCVKLHIQQGDIVPEPLHKGDYKGNISYRTSSKRHMALVKEAKRQDKSLSKLLDEVVDMTVLSSGKGFNSSRARS